MLMKRFHLLLAYLIAAVIPMHAVLPYQDSTLAVDQRIDDLLKRMTLAEKVGQLRCVYGWPAFEITRPGSEITDDYRRHIEAGDVGMLWATFRADPWTQRTLEQGLRPHSAAETANQLQRIAVEHSRLGIPLFLAEEGPHGHMAIGTTVFPTGLALAATFNSRLASRQGEITAREIRLQGGHITFGPVMDLALEPRWSRVEETLGEDPVLSAVMASAVVRGCGEAHGGFSTIATPKHFIAYGIPQGGHNGASSSVGPRALHAQFLPPFRQVVEAGARSLMTSYNSIDGIPATSNSHLLTDVLRGEWGFNGFVISDLYSINSLVNDHHTAADLQDAAIQALQAGVDVDLGGMAYETLVDAVNQGKIDASVIDRAVARVLRLKFEMHLFEHPYVDVSLTAQVGCDSAQAVSRQIATEAITLLKNDGTLPLRHGLTVALIGPNADNGYNMLGDYTAPQERETMHTVRDALTARLGASHVRYARGCGIRDTTHYNPDEAVAAARQADVIVAVVGGSSARDFDTKFHDTGAAQVGTAAVSDMESGEGFDRATLSLMGRQQELLQTLKQTGKPLIVVYIEGRPLDKLWASTQANALFTAYYPGPWGGEAIADVLLGDYNPAGRLPVSVPRSVGQLPVYYNQPRSARNDYTDLSQNPLYPFGFGLSYTNFAYSNLRISPLGGNEYTVTVDVTNTGNRDGDEVVQLYVQDDVASVVLPALQLRRFERCHLAAGETRQVTFALNTDDFCLVNTDLQQMIEPGTFTIAIGASSADIRCSAQLTIE